MNKPLSALIFTALLSSGCTNLFVSNDGEEDKASSRMCFNDDGSHQQCQDIAAVHTNAMIETNISVMEPATNINIPQDNPTLFQTDLHFQLLNDYVEQMALELSQDLLEMNIANPVAVASFVHLDSQLTNTDTLGNQLAEAFIAEMRKVGIMVNDHKVTGNIMVTPSGDLAFSRDIRYLKGRQAIGYVLTGTMVRNPKGMLINARVVGLTSNTVVAATSKLIPNILLAAN
jgi:TolB-like protein